MGANSWLGVGGNPCSRWPVSEEKVGLGSSPFSIFLDGLTMAFWMKVRKFKFTFLYSYLLKMVFLASAHCLETKTCQGSLSSLCRAPSPSGPPRHLAFPHFLSQAVPKTPRFLVSALHILPHFPLLLPIVCPVFLNPHPRQASRVLLPHFRSQIGTDSPPAP